MTIINTACKPCDGRETFEEVEPGGKVKSVCAECLGEGSLISYVCDYHPNEKVKADKGMCWICIAEDDDYRKSNRHRFR